MQAVSYAWPRSENWKNWQASENDRSRSSGRTTAVGNSSLTDSQLLVEIARRNPSAQIRAAAVHKDNFPDPKVLAGIFHDDPNGDVRLAAIEKISDQAILAEAAVAAGKTRNHRLVFGIQAG